MPKYTIRHGTPQVEAWYQTMKKKAAHGSLTSKEEDLWSKYLKTLRFLAENPRHPGLQTHEIDDLTKIFSKKSEASTPIKVWQSYLENQTSGARRIYWVYGLGKEEITVLALETHPNTKSSSYSSIRLSGFPPKKLASGPAKKATVVRKNRFAKKR